MVSGRGLPVVCVPRTYQCAEIDRIARGVRIAAPRALKPRLQTLSSIAFMGEPWPTKRTGIRPRLLVGLWVFSNSIHRAGHAASGVDAADASRLTCPALRLETVNVSERIVLGFKIR